MSYHADKLAIDTNTHTHTDPWMQAMTIPEGQNWSRVKKKYNKIVCIFNLLWRSDIIWWHRSGSALVQVMACCLKAPSHYPDQCWLIINEACWHLADGNFTETVLEITHKKVSGNDLFENTAPSPRDLWVEGAYCRWWDITKINRTFGQNCTPPVQYKSITWPAIYTICLHKFYLG